MSTKAQAATLKEILASIEIPDSAYEKAADRYDDLGRWFGKSDCFCAKFDPHIYPQGSFRLGTVIRPLTDEGEYDLDVGCRLREGITKQTHTQKYLKALVGDDAEAYRSARKIEKAKEEHNRCWRLHYKDELPFHMDVVPSIPEDSAFKQFIEGAMIKYGYADANLARNVTRFSGAITDKRLANYSLISPNWKESNSEGYALWFGSKMNLARGTRERAELQAKAAQVDRLPARKLSSPLQQCIKVLKRHRDIMFKDAHDVKPISIIITTLSAYSYNGEEDLEDAMKGILAKMDAFIRPENPRIPNPVNPAEDFADKWYTTDGMELNLEGNFWRWLKKAREDFNDLATTDDSQQLSERAMTKYGAKVDSRKLGEVIFPVPNVSAGLVSQVPKSPVDPRGGGRFG